MIDDQLHPRLLADSLPIGHTPHSILRLFNDSRWPWLLLMPRPTTGQPAATELQDLPEALRLGYLEDICRASAVMKHSTGCDSVNVAMLGNVVRDLHCHVVARTTEDPAWPAPVWGVGDALPYTTGNRPELLLQALASALTDFTAA